MFEAARRNDHAAAPSSAPTITISIAVSHGAADAPRKRRAATATMMVPAASAIDRIALDSEDKFIIVQAPYP